MLLENEKILNELNFLFIENSLSLTQKNTLLNERYDKFLDFENKINELNILIPVLDREENEKESYLSEIKKEILNFNEKNEKITEEIEKIHKETQNYELAIPKLKTNFNSLLQDVKELNLRKGKKNLEKFEEMVRLKSQILCVVCKASESGRMKKCVLCSAAVHAKCTKELKFLCFDCKNK